MSSGDDNHADNENHAPDYDDDGYDHYRDDDNPDHVDNAHDSDDACNHADHHGY